MIKTLKRISIAFACLLLTLIILPLITGIYLYWRADFLCPNVEVNLEDYPMQISTDSIRCIGNDYLRRNSYGLWEARISGTPIERGAKLGILASDLLHYQEEVFVEQIRNFVPSDTYLSFLHKLTAIFNGNMAHHIPEEYRKEIYAMSLSCSHKFDVFGTPYERQLNYHAAHDIGHTMQEYMLVGCSSFAVWGSQSSDSTLLVGRNFDFYVGDDFARNRLVLFVNPNKGHRYASITWPGMIGVVSGINDSGLTVTINAAKGKLPLSSAMPISLLVRDILQYASCIDEALKIAQRHRTFVSESILISSVSDGRAYIIEKTPETTALYRPEGEQLCCTNHFQSTEFAEDEYNQENIRLSDSPYRMKRLSELIVQAAPLTPALAVEILRDTKGVGGRDIGLCNQKSLNLCIAHHSVIFQPEQLRMWVSTSPWQAGRYICYDLHNVWNDTLYQELPYIPADSTFITQQLPYVVEYRTLSKRLLRAITEKQPVFDDTIAQMLKVNPEYYEAYNIAGDYELAQGNTDKACHYWHTALQKEVATNQEVQNIEKKLQRYDKK